MERNPIRRMTLVYALRSGWSAAERRDERCLREGDELMVELAAAHAGWIPADLLKLYGEEFDG